MWTIVIHQKLVEWDIGLKRSLVNKTRVLDMQEWDMGIKNNY